MMDENITDISIVTVTKTSNEGFIEILEAIPQYNVFPYMEHWKLHHITQRFSGTAPDHERVTTVGCLGFTDSGGVVLSLASSDGWVGVRNTGERKSSVSRHLGCSIDESFQYAMALPFASIQLALEHILNHR